MRRPIYLLSIQTLPKRCMFQRPPIFVAHHQLCSTASSCGGSSDEPSEDIQRLRARLLYQSSKRGILENDLIIGRFAEEHLSKMSPSMLAQYDSVINGEHMEWDLYYYLTGRREATPELENNSVFQRMRNYVQHFHKPTNS